MAESTLESKSQYTEKLVRRLRQDKQALIVENILMRESIHKLRRENVRLQCNVPHWTKASPNPDLGEYPEEEGEYLCHFTDGSIEIFSFREEHRNERFWGVSNLKELDAATVTHWMPLPEPPTSEQKK